jgi:CRISPR-associated protein Cmr2
MKGTLAALGPATVSEHADAWKRAASDGCNVGGIRIRPGERLSAPALVKRYAPVILAGKWGLDLHRDLRYPDTATVAAARWLADSGIDPASYSGWNGRWLHPGSLDDDDQPPPEELKTTLRKTGVRPTYYAVLVMDGDHMGRWLRGETAPAIGNCYHPRMTSYFKGLGRSEAATCLDTPRPLTPAFSASLSAALSNFSAQVAPRVVERHYGTVIYSGGDDVLAVLPVSEALGCAKALRLAFSGELSENQGAPRGYYRIDDRDLLVPGGATASTGIAVVHFMEDLRTAIDGARRAEKLAKETRNSLALCLMRRSGEEGMTRCGWSLAHHLKFLCDAFSDAVSDRWAYQLRRRLVGLEASALPAEAQTSLLRQALSRTESRTRQAIEVIVMGFWDAYRNSETGTNLGGFVSLCLGASFLARVSKGGKE